MANPFTQVPLADLQQRASIKWQFFDADVLPLWVAEMDVVVAEPITRAVHDAMVRGDTGYAFGSTYAEAFARFAADEWSADVEVSRTAMVSDAMMGIFELIRMLAAPDGSVVVASPVYPPFYSYAEHAGRRVVEAPLGDDLRLDFDALEAAFVQVKGSASVFLLCHPQNPTGTVHTRAELTQVAELAERHGVRVVSDEVHAPLVLDGEFTPYWTVDPRGFSITTASKGWNLAGLRTALIVGGSLTGADIAAIPEVVSHGPSHLAVFAHAAAFDEGRDWLAGVRSALLDNQAALSAALAEHAPQIRFSPGQATFLAWLDCRETSVADRNARPAPGDPALSAGPALAFVERARVGLNSGEAFGTGGQNWVRMNIGTSPEVITEAVRRIGAVV